MITVLTNRERPTVKKKEENGLCDDVSPFQASETLTDQNIKKPVKVENKAFFDFNKVKASNTPVGRCYDA